MADWIEDLERLNSLKERGHLSEAEHEIAKARILGQSYEPSARVYGEAETTPTVASANANHAEFADKPPIAKRLLLGAAIIFPVLLGGAWAIGQLAGRIGGGVVPNHVLKQCVGIGLGDMVERPFNQSFEVFLAGVRAGGVEPIAWEEAGNDTFNLRVQDGDNAKKVKEEGVYVIRKVSGNGGLPNCGPDTFRVERMLINDQDMGGQVAQGVIFALIQGMQAMKIKPEESKNKPAAALTPSPATTPPAKSDSYSALASAPRFSHPQSSSFDLTGVWAPEGEYCASGAPMKFRADGNVIEEYGAGAWNIKGDSLTILMNGKATKSTVRLISDDDIYLYWDKGGSTHYRRCPVSGGGEPWFPS